MKSVHSIAALILCKIPSNLQRSASVLISHFNFEEDCDHLVKAFISGVKSGATY